jgi:glycosyltransferase involved in cell wall biosynthesis
MSVFVDLTEFLTHPHRTGIQRVAGELCRSWPDSIPLRPVKLVHGRGLVELPASVLQCIAEYFRGGEEQTLGELRSLVEKAEQGGRLAGDGIAIVVPEVFFDAQRIAYFRELSQSQLARCYFIVFDALPLTHPHYFAADVPYDVISAYFCLVRDAPHTGFISNQTREVYYRRLKRASMTDGPVLRLGSDGLGPRGEHERTASSLFAVIGTIEPRKNHQLILDAFEPLFKQIPDLQLAFLGRMGWVDTAFADRVRKLARNNENFTFIENPSDLTIRAYIERARATLFLSTAEGFGLPPVESLWLDTPVIASSQVPSLEEIGSQGVCRVDPLDVEGIRKSVRLFLDPEYYKAKATEARELNLPTWTSFAEQVAQWVTSTKLAEARFGHLDEADGTS